MEMKAEHRTGSNLAQENAEQPKEQEGRGAQGAATQDLNLSAGAFTTFYTWRANGINPSVNFGNANVKANSRVLLNISEYSANPQDRFIGAARMAVYNIAPYNGGFRAWVDISWNSPLNIRFDVFVDP